MPYWQALTLICFSGIAGGLVYAVSSLLDSGKAEKTAGKDESGNPKTTYGILKGLPLEVFLLGRAVLGAGGAIALVLALIATKHYDNQNETGNLLYLTTVCFVAGFVGQRVLNEVASKLVKQIAEDTAKGVATTTAKEIVATETAQVKKDVTDYTQVMADINQALAVLAAIKAEESPNPEIVLRRTAELEAWRKNPAYRSLRRLNIVLARLYAFGSTDPKHLDKAIDVLEEFAKERKQSTGGKNDVNFSDAMFNIACYHVKKRDAASTAQEKEKERSKALEALSTSIEAWPLNAASAEAIGKGQDGEEFLTLSEDPEFKAIIAEGKARVI